MRKCLSGVVRWGLHPGAGQLVKEKLDRMQLILLQEPKEDEPEEVLNTGCRSPAGRRNSLCSVDGRGATRAGVPRCLYQPTLEAPGVTGLWQ